MLTSSEFVATKQNWQENLHVSISAKLNRRFLERGSRGKCSFASPYPPLILALWSFKVFNSCNANLGRRNRNELFILANAIRRRDCFCVDHNLGRFHTEHG